MRGGCTLWFDLRCFGRCMNSVLGDCGEPSLASLMDFQKEGDKIDPGAQFTRVDLINTLVLGLHHRIK